MKISKFLVIVLALTMVISNVDVAMAKEPESCNISAMTGYVYRFELGNGADMRVRENEERRVAEYYVNNIRKQIAVLDKNTGDIYYCDLNLENVSLSRYSADTSILSESNTSKYNIQSFMKSQLDNEIGSTTPRKTIAYSNNNFRLVKSKTLSLSGTTYIRYLYGYNDSKQYEQNSWHFAAGTALAVIGVACGFIPQVGLALSAVSSVAGCIVSSFAVKEWIKEFFWVYKFNQTSPTVLEFVCPQQFTYEKQRRVEINGDEGYWETIEQQADWQIENIRNEILESPGYYI